ncbi:MAG TPA: class II aldolase/adducin family protein [Chloroflexi bacterium]|nr:class II aldolase/adducin family protein [Chloroflexota bacterium]
MLDTYRRVTLAIVRMVNSLRGGTYAQAGELLLTPRDYEQVSEAGRLAFERELVYPTIGELSLRLRGERMVITRAGADFASLEKESLLVCSLQPGKPVGSAPRRLEWHRAVYAATSAGGVLICQPPHTILATLADLPLRSEWAPEIFEAIGGVVSSGELPLAETAPVAEAASEGHAVLLPGVGALVWGDSPLDAVYRAGALEYIARLAFLAHQGGLSDHLVRDS